MERIKIGQTAKKFGISRCTCADGAKCRVALIDTDCVTKWIAYDETARCTVEVTQELSQKYGLRPKPIYLFMVAKLNTDLSGRIVGNQFTVEYLQLPGKTYEEFSDTVNENPNYKTILLSKVKQKGDDGKDFSYLRATASAAEIDDPTLLAKLDELRNNKEFMDGTWAMIDAATSVSPEVYEMRLKGAMVTDDMEQKQLAAAQGAVNTQHQVEAPKVPTTQIEEAQEFETPVAKPTPTPKPAPVDDWGSAADDFTF